MLGCWAGGAVLGGCCGCNAKVRRAVLTPADAVLHQCRLRRGLPAGLI